MKNIDPNATAEQRAAITLLCSPESYLEAVKACVEPSEAKKLKPNHLANFLALAAEHWLLRYPGLSEAYERGNSLTIDFKAILGPEKTDVQIQYKPVDVFKDVASAPLPHEDDDQPDLFKQKPGAPKPAAPAPESKGSLELPAPVNALPAPALTAAEKKHIEKIRKQGYDARAGGEPSNANPHPIKSIDRAIWKEGWSERDREEKAGEHSGETLEAEEVEPTAGGVEIVGDDDVDDIEFETK